MGRYTNTQIAEELIKTALYEAYHGNALYVAMSIPGLTESEKDCLSRWLNRSPKKGDSVNLQRIAHKIMDNNEVLS